MENQKRGQSRLVEIQTRQPGSRLVTMLVYLRKSKHMTQQDIADMTGMQKASVDRIEGKRYTPTIEMLLKYMACLGMKIDFLLKERNET